MYGDLLDTSSNTLQGSVYDFYTSSVTTDNNGPTRSTLRLKVLFLSLWDMRDSTVSKLTDNGVRVYDLFLY